MVERCLRRTTSRSRKSKIERDGEQTVPRWIKVLGNHGIGLDCGEGDGGANGGSDSLCARPAVFSQ